jgi:formamidopyrimidine-DNA glycosylase
MAQDLAPLITGATITSAWWDWDKAISNPQPDAFGREISGARVLGVGRRAKWVVVELSDSRVMAIRLPHRRDLIRCRPRNRDRDVLGEPRQRVAQVA